MAHAMARRPPSPGSSFMFITTIKEAAMRTNSPVTQNEFVMDDGFH